MERVRRFVVAVGADKKDLSGAEALRLLAWWGLVRAESEERKRREGLA